MQIKAVISTGTDDIRFDQCASVIKPKLKNGERTYKHLDCTSITFNFQLLRINGVSKHTSCTMNKVTSVICGI